MPIRLLLVDDHAAFRDSIAHVLSHEPDVEIAGVSASVEEAVEILGRNPVDIVLLDYDLGGERGTYFLRTARAHGYAGSVLIVSAGVPVADLQTMMRDGVGGLFLKEQPLETLLEAIRTVAEGRVWFDPRQFRELLVTPEAHDIFDERERIILRGIVKGLSNKEIANRLNVPETTVKSGVQRLFEKTGVRTRGSLVRVAFEKYRHLVE